jgi:hypothetical protein
VTHYIYILTRVIDLLVYHLDSKVESIDEPVDRHCHLDSHARLPSSSPARACLPRAPVVLFASRPRSIAMRPGPTPHAQRRARSRVLRLRLWLSHFLRFRCALNYFCYNDSVIFRSRQPFLSSRPFSFNDSVIF